MVSNWPKYKKTLVLGISANYWKKRMAGKGGGRQFEGKCLQNRGMAIQPCLMTTVHSKRSYPKHTNTKQHTWGELIAERMPSSQRSREQRGGRVQRPQHTDFRATSWHTRGWLQCQTTRLPELAIGTSAIWRPRCWKKSLPASNKEEQTSMWRNQYKRNWSHSRLGRGWRTPKYNNSYSASSRECRQWCWRVKPYSQQRYSQPARQCYSSYSQESNLKKSH